jgi:hypothetical protein
LKFKSTGITLLWVVGLLVTGGLGCNSKEAYIGTYQAIDSSGLPEGGIRIELMKNGKGVWKRGDEEVPFSWYIKKDEIRINTKDGGIMIGHFKRKGITMNMPGDVEITFQKLF